MAWFAARWCCAGWGLGWYSSKELQCGTWSDVLICGGCATVCGSLQLFSNSGVLLFFESFCLLLAWLQFQHPAQSSPASFRALDVRPGGSELLLGTHCYDLWELNPAASGIGAAAANTARAGPGAAAAASVLPEPLIQGHTGDVWGVAYHPLKPHRFVTACESSSIYVWHGRRRQLMVRLLYHHCCC